MSLDIFILLFVFLVPCALWLFSMISADCLTNSKATWSRISYTTWSHISYVSHYLSIALLIAGSCLMFAVATKSVTSPGNEILCTYLIQDSDALTLSSADKNTTTLSLIDTKNNTITISTRDDDVQYIADHKYPLVEKIRVKMLFIYRDVYLIHL